MWQPSVEVSWVLSGFRLLTDKALPQVPFPSKSSGVLILVTYFSHQEAPFTQMLAGAGNLSIKERRDATSISPFVWKADPRLNGIGLELRKEQADEPSVLSPLSWGPAHSQTVSTAR